MLKRKPSNCMPGLFALLFKTYVIPFAILFIIIVKVYNHVPVSVKATVFNDWSDGRIAFASERDGNWEIYTINPDGTGLNRLTSTRNKDETYPSWSPDGERIVFQSLADGNFDIEIMRSDGSGRHKLTKTIAKDVEPVFSPSGDEIAFTSYRDGDAEIFVMQADGKGVMNISKSGYIDTSPSWSHDGNYVYFKKQESGSNGFSRIFVVDHSGGEAKEISETFPYLGNVPTWNRKGRKVAFIGGRLARQEEGVIYTMRPASSTFHALYGKQSRISNSSPMFSPDGGRLVFCRTVEGGNQDICIAKPDGSGFINLTGGEGANIDPDWGPDPQSQMNVDK